MSEAGGNTESEGSRGIEAVQNEKIEALLGDYSYLLKMRLIAKSHYGKQRDFIAAMGNFMKFIKEPMGFIEGRLSGLQSVLSLLGRNNDIEEIERKAPEEIQSPEARKELYRHSQIKRISEYFQTK